MAATGTCQRNTRKCRPQREHRHGWRSRWRARSMTFRMPTVRKSIDLQRGHCARNSTSPATIMITILHSARLGEQRVAPVGLQQHARAFWSCLLKCWTNSCHSLHVGCDASTIFSPSIACSCLTFLHKRLTYASASDNSQTIASVVSISDAMDAAFCSAVRVTFVGSITPDLTRSSY
jgi:hypothetical protein